MNPLLLKLLPFAVSAALAASVAWYVQGVRLDSARNDLTEYKQSALGQQLEEKQKHQELNERTADEWSKGLAALRDCYESGRCRMRVESNGMPAGRVPNTSQGADDKPADFVFGAGGLAYQCAETTLQLIRLQGWVNSVSP